ncbi:DUF6894 family protein [Methylobacterium oryzisoli]|uniref:DUF6894 family protein n=1 Tax=Methylobacterium oryzisoli TaxID=3385502 RepID=UPI003891C4B6
MARYFFDVHDVTLQRDEIGSDCASLDQVREQALRFLPDVAREQALDDGDRHAYTGAGDR